MTEREWCEEDDGTGRNCCGTAQLGPHGAACPKSPKMQDALRYHELAYRHRAEVPAQIPDEAGFEQGIRQILGEDHRSG
jgi:hypothetical protein